MAQNIATLAVKFVADTFGLKAGAATAGNLIKSIGSGVSNLGGIFGTLGGTVGQVTGAFSAAGPAGAIAAGALVAVGAGAFAAHKALDQVLASSARIDATSKLATRLDLTYKSLQKLTFLAGDSGVPLDVLAKAMEHMQREIGSGGLSIENRFAQQAKRLAAMKDPALRAAEAYRLFGKEGTKLIPLLDGMASNAARFDRFGKAFGFAIEDKDARNVERMNTAWGDMVYIGTQLADKFVSKFGGPIAAFLENAIDMTIEWSGALNAMGFTWDDVGGFAVSVLAQINGWWSLSNGLLKVNVGFLEQIYGGYEKISGFINGDNGLIAQGSNREFAGNSLMMSGAQDVDDFWSGKTGQRFQDRIANGTDFSKRGGGFGGGDFGGSGGFPAALQRGSAGAISATLQAGGNPLGAIQQNTKEMLESLLLIHRELKTPTGDKRTEIILSPAGVVA